MNAASSCASFRTKVCATAATGAVFIVLIQHGGCAQEMEPRAYSAVPIDTNFVVGSFRSVAGDVALDPSLPISNVKASVETAALGYDRTFELFGQTASVALLVPYLYGDLSGDVCTEGRKITRQGLGDAGLRFTYHFIGNPALAPAEFARREPTTTVGVNVALVVPSGVYNSERLINVGSNRWALRPEIGFSHPIGRWFVEGSAGVWIFTDNPDFYGGNVRGQDPLWTLGIALN